MTKQESESKPLPTASSITAITGLSALCFTLVYGAAGWGTMLTCFGLIICFEYLFHFRGQPVFNPYTLMLLSPLLLWHYSSVTDFRIRALSFVFLLYIVTAACSESKKPLKFSLIKAKPKMVWLTAFLIFSLSSIVLYVQGIHLSGDEPHYLAISQSLTEDGDFDLKNNFEEKTYYEFLPIDLRFHGGEYNGKHLSFHLPGVSFLLLPFYWLFNLLGGLIPPALYFRLAASVINAFFALCLFQLLKLKFRGKEITGFWLFFLVVFPLVFHGVHLFPELPAATLMMAAYLSVFGEKKNILLAGLFLGLVPWFHVKYIPALVVLALAILYDLLGPLKGFSLDKLKIRELIRFLIFPVICFIFLVIYSKTLYGSYSPADIFPKESYWSVPWLLRLKVFLAYFLDQKDGLLFYSPLFFVFFFSFGKKWEGKNLLLGVAFVYVFFHAFTTVRGAYSPAGRPLMFVSWIFILFIGHFYFNVLKETGTRGSGLALIYRMLVGLSVFVVVWLFYYPLFVYQPVFAGTVERASGFNLFFGSDFIELWRLFPSFLTSPGVGHPANFVWIGLLVVLVCVYYLNLKRLKFSKQGIAVFLLFMVLAFFYCFYPHVHLIGKNKYNGKVISFYNNSKNFRYLPEKSGFRIKAGNDYDIFIDRKMVKGKGVGFYFSNTDVSSVILRNGRDILFRSGGGKESFVSLRLSSLSTLRVGNKTVSHISFETKTSTKNAYLWLEVK